MTAALEHRRSLWGELWRYGATGLANMALGYSLIMGCFYLLGSTVLVANLVGYGAGWCLSFILNKRWTFRHDGSLGRTVFGFVSLVVLAFCLNLAVTLGLSQAGLAYPIAQFLGAATYSVVTFAGLKWIVFTHD
ncbi:MAG: GtrA family protein [Pseudomonadota bacterium]